MVAVVRNDDTDGKKAVLQIIDVKDFALFWRIERFGGNSNLFFGMNVDGRVRHGIFCGRRIGLSTRERNDADEKKVQRPQASQRNAERARAHGHYYHLAL